MYQMDPAGIDAVGEAEDPHDEATSEIPARPRTPPMMSRTRKAFRNVRLPLPTRRPARCVRHARSPLSPTVATPQKGMGSQNLNALCDGRSLTELRTGRCGRVLARCDREASLTSRAFGACASRTGCRTEPVRRSG